MDRSKEMKVPVQKPEEELREVTGGNWYKSEATYKSGDTPRYQVGQTVLDRYYIKAVNPRKSGVINREFTYVVAESSDHDKIYSANMYESELMRAEGLL